MDNLASVYKERLKHRAEVQEDLDCLEKYDKKMKSIND